MTGTEADCVAAETVTCNDGLCLSNDQQMIMSGGVLINTQSHCDKLCLLSNAKLQPDPG